MRLQYEIAATKRSEREKCEEEQALVHKTPRRGSHASTEASSSGYGSQRDSVSLRVSVLSSRRDKEDVKLVFRA